jgi:hypothetical protein
VAALRRAWAVAALTLLSVALAGCGGAMRPEELARSVDTLASSASEGGLVADGVARQRTKATFARVRARELGETVDHEAEKLSDATPQDAIRAKKVAAVNLATRISEALGEIQTAPKDAEAARETERKLNDLSKRADDLAKSL